MSESNDVISVAPLTGEQVLISVNPKAGAGPSRSRAEQLVEILSKHGLKARIETDLDQIGTEACKLASLGKLRALVGVGGDGTATELANRISKDVPLAMLPAGTENLLARHIGWPKSPEQLAKVLLNGRKMCIDIGQAGSRRFLLMLSCGVDAEVVRRVDQKRNGHISHASYIGPIFHTVCHYKYPKIKVNCTQQEKSPENGDFHNSGKGGVEVDVKGGIPPASISDNESVATWVVISNISLYGGGIRFSPEADETDGFFDVCQFHESGFLKSLQFFTAAKWGKCQKVKGCSERQAVRVRLTAEEPLPYQIDGDPGGTLPVEIKLLPQALTLLVPKTEH